MCQSLQQLSALSCEALITLSVSATSALIVPQFINQKSINGWMAERQEAASVLFVFNQHYIFICACVCLLLRADLFKSLIII